MPRIKLDESRTYRQGWGVHSYMLHTLKYKDDGSAYLLCTNLRFSTSGVTKREAIEYAEKWSNEYWVCLVHFSIPLKTTFFGDRRGMGVIGFSVSGKKLELFKKPLRLFDALEEIEDQVKAFTFGPRKLDKGGLLLGSRLAPKLNRWTKGASSLCSAEKFEEVIKALRKEGDWK